LHISIPPEYVSDKNARLQLYRRIADLRNTSEIDPLIEEFQDRFGIPPAPVRNLLFQLKIKLLAEKANVASINVESDQIVVRFRDGSFPADLPYLGSNVRIGKTALWLPHNAQSEWPDHLVGLLHRLQELTRPE
jgi:transcription-repair coupling factor (superfamily II helicase)